MQAIIVRGQNVVNSMKSILPLHEKFNGCGVYNYHDAVKYAVIADIKNIKGKMIAKESISLWRKKN